jgi:hypothetical protein
MELGGSAQVAHCLRLLLEMVPGDSLGAVDLFTKAGLVHQCTASLPGFANGRWRFRSGADRTGRVRTLGYPETCLLTAPASSPPTGPGIFDSAAISKIPSFGVQIPPILSRIPEYSGNSRILCHCTLLLCSDRILQNGIFLTYCFV